MPLPPHSGRSFRYDKLGTSSLVGQNEEERHISGCLDPDTLSIKDSTGDSSHLEPFRSRTRRETQEDIRQIPTGLVRFWSTRRDEAEIARRSNASTSGHGRYARKPPKGISPTPTRRILRLHAALCGGVHRHDHYGLLFTALCLDHRGLVHPPYNAIANGNLVDGLVKVLDLQLRHGIQEVLRALFRVR